MKNANIKSYRVIKNLVGLLLLNQYSEKIYRKNLYLSLYDMPLGNYIRLTVDGDLRQLSKTNRKIPQAVALKVFAELQKQYSDMSDNKVLEGQITRQSEKDYLKTQIFFYSSALNLIHNFDNMDGAIVFFNNNGIFGSANEVQNQALAEVKALKSKLDDLEALDKANSEDVQKRVTREDYSKVILVAGKNGYHITYKSSVADFISAMQLQKEEISRLQSHGGDTV